MFINNQLRNVLFLFKVWAVLYTGLVSGFELQGNDPLHSTGMMVDIFPDISLVKPVVWLNSGKLVSSDDSDDESDDENADVGNSTIIDAFYLLYEINELTDEMYILIVCYDVVNNNVIVRRVRAAKSSSDSRQVMYLNPTVKEGAGCFFIQVCRISNSSEFKCSSMNECEYMNLRSGINLYLEIKRRKKTIYPWELLLTVFHRSQWEFQGGAAESLEQYWDFFESNLLPVILPYFENKEKNLDPLVHALCKSLDRTGRVLNYVDVKKFLEVLYEEVVNDSELKVPEFKPDASVDNVSDYLKSGLSYIRDLDVPSESMAIVFCAQLKCFTKKCYPKEITRTILCQLIENFPSSKPDVQRRLAIKLTVAGKECVSEY